MIILGINPGSHESSACIIRDGKVLFAIEEERLTRVKHGIGTMPHRSMVACLEYAKIDFSEVDFIAICWARPSQPEGTVELVDPNMTEAQLDYYRLEILPPRFMHCRPLPRFAHVSHHLSHAAAIYRTSGLESSAILVIDGQGDTVSTSIMTGAKNGISTIRSWNIGHSLGYFYQAATTYLGLGPLGSEGKTMGLAAYGRPRFAIPEIRVSSDGYVCDGACRSEMTGKEVMMSWMHLFENRVSGFRSDRVSGRSAWKHSQPGTFSQTQCDFAASVQTTLQEVVVNLAKLALQESHQQHLMICGGVGLNCSVNQAICDAIGGSNVSFMFAPNDSGAAIGAGLELYYYLTSKCSNESLGPFLGPEFSDDSIREYLERVRLPYTSLSDRSAFAADAIMHGKTVGWFQGRMEFGPRALCNRSILANPSWDRMQQHINDNVKRRERWRPFGPVLLESKSTEIFGQHQRSCYMARAMKMDLSIQELFPASVHVDGTTRAQTIADETDSSSADLLRALDLLGLPLVLNTSLNDERRPIACSPRDAVEVFLTSALNVLIIGDVSIGGKV